MNVIAIKIPFDEMLKITPTGGLSDEGKDEITRIVMRDCRIQLPAEFFQSPSKTAVSKRLTQWLADQGHDYPSSLPTMVGNIVGENSIGSQEITFRFTRNLNWKAGDYGDDGSCFWGSNTAAMALLRHYGAFAVQFLTSDGTKGLGRCFGYQPHPGMIVLFNSYGLLNADDVYGRPDSSVSRGRQDAKLVYAARVVAEYLQSSYRSVLLKNRGSDNGLVYINSSRGYLVGDKELLSLLTAYDLEMDENVLPKCSRCGNISEASSLKTVPGKGTMCPKCYADYFVTCTNCGNEHPKETALSFDNRYFCSKKCASAMNYRECANCGHVMPMEFLIYAQGAQQWVCPSCASRRYRTCCDCFGLYNVQKEKFVVKKTETPSGAPYNRLQCAACAKAEDGGEKPVRKLRPARAKRTEEVAAPDPLSP